MTKMPEKKSTDKKTVKNTHVKETTTVIQFEE